MAMLRHSFSPIRIFCGFAAIGVVVLIYMTLNPKLAVAPVPSTDPAAPFGTIFDLHNKSVAVLYDLSSSSCVNSFNSPGNNPPPADGAMSSGIPSQTMTLADLSRGDTAVLPLENAYSGPPGSQVDLVFTIKFQPGWWIDLLERQYRFVGTEGKDKTWSWKPMPLGSPCG
jgi:hypothetical protein